TPLLLQRGAWMAAALCVGLVITLVLVTWRAGGDDAAATTSTVDLVRAPPPKSWQLEGLGSSEFDGTRQWRWALGPVCSIGLPTTAQLHRMEIELRLPIAGQVVEVAVDGQIVARLVAESAWAAETVVHSAVVPIQ